jgi:O-antigen/teichoic acid export membrane protein
MPQPYRREGGSSARESRAAVRTPSLRRNVVWAAVGNVGYAACQWAVLVVLAKLSSAEEVGRFALGLAVTAPVMIAAGMQLRVVQATDAREDYRFGAYLGLRLAAVTVALLAIFAIGTIAGYPRATLVLIMLVAAAKACEGVSDIVFGLLQRHEDLRRVALSMLVKGVSSVASIALTLWLTGSVLVATIAMALSWGSVLALYDLRAARRLAALRPVVQPRTLSRLAWLASPLGLVAGLQSLMTNVPRYAVEAHGGPRALGYFAAIAYLILAGNQPVMALWAAVSPRLAQLFVADRRAYRRLARRTMLLAAAMGALTVGAAATAGRPLLAVLYAPDYAAHADVLVWLSVVAAFGYLSSALCCSITAARRFPEQLVVAALALAVSWGGARVLVPRFGLVGAAWALLAATATQALSLALIYALVSSGDAPDDRPAARALTADAAEPLIA